MATKRLEPALLEIDPGDRALLALSLHRGMADEEVADLLGAAPEDVVRRRASALGAVAGAAGLGAERAGGDLEAELRALPPEAWREGGGGTSEPPPRKRRSRCERSWRERSQYRRRDPRRRLGTRLGAIALPALCAGALVLWLAPTTSTTADRPALDAGPSQGPRNIVLDDATPAAGPRVGGKGGRRPPPTEISIPQVGLEASIKPVGATSEGIRVPPLDRAGWFDGGPRPGEPGRTVVIGHLDSTDGPAIFANVPSIEPGTEIEVTSANGRTHRYESRRTVNVSKSEFPTETVYRSTRRSTLVVITCSGEYDPDSGYEENVVLFAQRI